MWRPAPEGRSSPLWFGVQVSTCSCPLWVDVAGTAMVLPVVSGLGGRDIKYVFGDPVHHRDSAMGPSLFKWFPFQLMHYISDWGGVPPSVGFVHPKSCCPSLYHLELVHMFLSAGIPYWWAPVHVSPQETKQVVCRAGDSIYVVVPGKLGVNSYPPGTAWIWLTWPLLLPSCRGTSLGVSPCLSMWGCCIWRL